jgi:hypothetical protein
MSMMLTFWKNGGNPSTRTPDDFDELFTIRLKTTAQLPSLIANRPRNCTMVSTEHTGNHIGRKGGKVNNLNPRDFKERWRIGMSTLPRSKKCPLCGHEEKL